MAVGTRLKGTSGFYLSFKIGAGTATVLGDDVKSWSLTPEAKDDSDLTFTEAATGLGANWTLGLTAIISFDTGTLWNYLWANPGVDVTFVLGPKGNSVATATSPTFTGVVNLGLKPSLSNEAGTSGEGAEFEVELVGTSDITKLVA